MIENNRLVKYLEILQILRGVAALMVVLHHTIGSIEYYHGVNNFWLNFMQSIGKYGVDFFFVLSGFIISYTAHFKKKEPNLFSNYLKNRLIRIYVPYLPIGILMYLLYLPSFSNSTRIISDVATFTLWPAGNPALSVAWTLSFEIIFYILFSTYFLSKKLWYSCSTIWVILIILFNYTSVLNELSNIKIFTHLMSPYNLEFLLGVLLSYLVLSKFKPPIYITGLLTLLSISIFLYFSFHKIENIYVMLNFQFSIFCFLLIFLSIAYKNIFINEKNLWMLIGNATFSIYLLHNNIQSLIVRLFPKIELGFRVVLMIVLCFVISCVVGYVYYLIFEVIMTQKAKRLFK